MESPLCLWPGLYFCTCRKEQESGLPHRRIGTTAGDRSKPGCTASGPDGYCCIKVTSGISRGKRFESWSLLTAPCSSCYHLIPVQQEGREKLTVVTRRVSGVPQSHTAPEPHGRLGSPQRGGRGGPGADDRLLRSASSGQGPAGPAAQRLRSTSQRL